ncbi:uncharacterized protein MONOS_7431 [Monocercomonoides exilis]|uniref:uncharacterized protein n=1 Tax=Monocercomonoides exilis TaxID=2049356 RepID=UPI00355A78F6|nr:hypothetical protein MONOS_7431 [Monocercomonoides exilis]|eukprot:MONOS_7431.1-p1 / transcript=MONOS_7431.1 / gene=MONOS_7431 / organism=Monocercomonoides_exilis_PA203 / gene_product=unspecified product / transcript_product=unspecified product / location=Mono_scaffold00253:68368-70247(+) / protein_length=542 / sequence_SO=supercontig / SO=protein_coding / is_pseudo=false
MKSPLRNSVIYDDLTLIIIYQHISASFFRDTATFLKNAGDSMTVTAFYSFGLAAFLLICVIVSYCSLGKAFFWKTIYLVFSFTLLMVGVVFIVVGSLYFREPLTKEIGEVLPNGIFGVVIALGVLSIIVGVAGSILDLAKAMKKRDKDVLAERQYQYAVSQQQQQQMAMSMMAQPAPLGAVPGAAPAMAIPQQTIQPAQQMPVSVPPFQKRENRRRMLGFVFGLFVAVLLLGCLVVTFVSLFSTNVYHKKFKQFCTDPDSPLPPADKPAAFASVSSSSSSSSSLFLTSSQIAGDAAKESLSHFNFSSLSVTSQSPYAFSQREHVVSAAVAAPKEGEEEEERNITNYDRCLAMFFWLLMHECKQIYTGNELSMCIDSRSLTSVVKRLSDSYDGWMLMSGITSAFGAVCLIFLLILTIMVIFKPDLFLQSALPPVPVAQQQMPMTSQPVKADPMAASQYAQPQPQMQPQMQPIQPLPSPVVSQAPAPLNVSSSAAAAPSYNPNAPLSSQSEMIAAAPPSSASAGTAGAAIPLQSMDPFQLNTM